MSKQGEADLGSDCVVFEFSPNRKQSKVTKQITVICQPQPYLSLEELLAANKQIDKAQMANRSSGFCRVTLEQCLGRSSCSEHA